MNISKHSLTHIIASCSYMRSSQQPELFELTRYFWLPMKQHV